MKKGKNTITIGILIALLLSKYLFQLISQKTGRDVSDIAMIGVFLLLGGIFTYLAIQIFKQKRYDTVVTFSFLSISWFIAAGGMLIDNLTIKIIGLVIFIVSAFASYFTIMRFNKKHGINR